MNKSAIIGQWVHAHERDVAGTKTMVDSAESLPPSRGRQRLTFREDGTFVENGPGADDRSVAATGTFQFDGTKLVLERPGGSAPVAYAVERGVGQALLLKKAN